MDYGDGLGERPLALDPDGIFDLNHVYSAAGSYSVTVAVTDDDGDKGIDTVPVTVITAEQAVQDMVDTVEEFNLQSGIDSSLDAKLEAAVRALDDLNENNDVAAINALEAFVRAVEAQRGRALTDEQAERLIEMAQTIIDSLT